MSSLSVLYLVYSERAFFQKNGSSAKTLVCRLNAHRYKSLRRCQFLVPENHLYLACSPTFGEKILES